MKRPIELEQVFVLGGQHSDGPYPPLGFVGLQDAELGNGDYFGLYWPIGREDVGPIICDMVHDESKLLPCFSSLGKFIEYLDINDWDRGGDEIKEEGFAPELFQRAKRHLVEGESESAVRLLRKSCDLFPESAEYWFQLSDQLRRVGEDQESATAALRSFISNWVFGLPSESVLRSLRQPKTKEILQDEPLLQIVDDLSLRIGGKRDGPTYGLMRECALEYFRLSRPVDGLLLYQNYSYMMCSETATFQERSQFDVAAWQSDFSTLCQHYLGDNRSFGAEEC